MKLEKKQAVAPLLPANENISSGASFTSAVFNVSTGMIGAGIMSIPATLKVLGIIPGFIAVVVVALLVEVTVEFMLRYTNSGECDTYGGLMGESFGRPGSLALQICVMVTNLGCLIIYLIILGDVLSGNESHLGILQEWFGTHWWTSRAYSLLFVVLFVMLPMLLLRRVESLQYASAVSILLAVVFVVICSMMAISALLQGKTQHLRLFPDFSSLYSIFSLFTTIPVYVIGFSFHVNVHPIRAELGKPSEMARAVRVSLILCVGIYCAIGFFGYLLFGDAIMADMLVNFDHNSSSTMGAIINDFVRLSYAIHLMLVFPVMNFSLRANVDEFLFPKKPLLATDTTRFVSLTCALLSLTYLAAVAVPNIWIFFQYLGSTTVLCLSFIFPASIILRDVHGLSTKRDRIMATMMIAVAVLTGAITIATNMYGGTKAS
ncbi:Amino acid transporter, transmembrane domain [Dillenia turbinata]|uniref:Amino acid transporter, transmembrane domain n=1 Tax=Dillenia turbinata TaxID=194707 RepID=A0AAN8V6Y7_9MAGN